MSVCTTLFHLLQVETSLHNNASLTMSYITDRLTSHITDRTVFPWQRWCSASLSTALATTPSHHLRHWQEFCGIFFSNRRPEFHNNWTLKYRSTLSGSHQCTQITNSPDHPIYQLHIIVVSYKGQKICHGTTRPCLKPVQFNSELANLLCIDKMTNSKFSTHYTSVSRRLERPEAWA